MDGIIDVTKECLSKQIIMQHYFERFSTRQNAFWAMKVSDSGWVEI